MFCKKQQGLSKGIALCIALCTLALTAGLSVPAHAQTQPDALDVFNSAEHGFVSYNNLQDKIREKGDTISTNRLAFNGMVDITTRNAAIVSANTNFQEHAEGVVETTSSSALYTKFDQLRGEANPIPIQRNYLVAFNAFNAFMASADNTNRAQAAVLGTNLKTAADALVVDAREAQNQVNNLIAAYNNIQNARAHSQNAIDNLVTLQANEANARTALNMYAASANAFRDLTFYTGLNHANGTFTPGIAPYENAVTQSNAAFLEGGFVGSYGGENYGQNITNGIMGAVVAAAKDTTTEVAAASHAFEEYLHNISRARFATNDTANNAFKTALNSLETEAAFSARTSALSAEEAALNTALVAYAANRNNAGLQAGVSNAAKVLANSANANIMNAVADLYDVELDAVAASVTADSTLNTSEFAFTSALQNLGNALTFHGSTASARNAAAAYRKARTGLTSAGQVQNAVGTAAFTAFNTAYATAQAVVNQARLNMGYLVPLPTDAARYREITTTITTYEMASRAAHAAFDAANAAYMPYERNQQLALAADRAYSACASGTVTVTVWNDTDSATETQTLRCGRSHIGRALSRTATAAGIEAAPFFQAMESLRGPVHTADAVLKTYRTSVEAELAQLSGGPPSSRHLYAVQAQIQAVTHAMNTNINAKQAEADKTATALSSARTAFATANTALVSANATRDRALDAVVANVVALNSTDRAPYSTQIAIIEATGSTTAQVSAAKVALAGIVNSRATDGDTGTNPSTALTSLSTAYQTAVTAQSEASMAKTNAMNAVTAANTAHTSATTALNSATETRDDFVVRAMRVVDAETGSRATIAQLSKALREADENRDGTAEYDKPIEILNITMDIHNATRAVAGAIVSTSNRIATLNNAIAANKDLIDRNTAAIAAQARHINLLQKRARIAVNGIAAAYALAGVPQLSGDRLNLTISAGTFDGEEAFGITFHGQVSSKVAFSGAVVRSGHHDGLAAGVTIGL